MSKNDDLVRRLRERDADWQKQCDGWFSNPDFASTETEAAVRRTLYCEAADAIEHGAAQGIVTDEMVTVAIREYVGEERYARDYEYVDAQLKPQMRVALEAALGSTPPMQPTPNVVDHEATAAAMQAEIERLRRELEFFQNDAVAAWNKCEERRLQADSAEASNKALREGLEPFAREADQWEGYSDDENLVEGWTTGPSSSLNVGDLRRARALLSET